MSNYEWKLPDIGEGVVEGEIVSWLVQPGEAVTEDQPMVEVMTDKATVTIGSPRAGRVVELRGAVGDVVPVHSVLVVLEVGGAASPAEVEAPAPAPRPPPRRDTEGPAATAVGDIREELPGTRLPVSRPQPAVVRSAPEGYFEERPLATPATRRLARELEVDLRRVPPTGKGGRVVKDDVQAFALSAPSAASRPPAGASASSPVALPVQSAERETRVPLRGVRRRIFDAMARSKHTAAHFTFVEECDVSALKQVRDRLRPAAEAEGVRLTYLPFFVKAAVAALKKHPALNAAFDESTQEIVQKHHYDIGIASATEAGLMVPVVRDADSRTMLEVAREIQRLSEATKSGRVAAADLTGSTFTITSLGQQGGLFATPILNTPELGILGLHRMKERPVVRGGQIVIGQVMLVSLSFDHRLIDGHVGAAFAYELIRYVESPELLLLEL